MKTLKVVSLLALISCMLVSSIYANSENSENIIYFADENISIIFDDSATLTAEKQQFIANAIVYGSPVQSRAWCWLLGHSYVENTVTAITHKVSDSEPRCWEDIYAITTCENCDYYEENLLGSGMTICCPED